MSAGLVAVLVVGLAILASLKARRKGYSDNQRIVLSGIAIGLLLLSLFPDVTPGKAVLIFVGIAVLVFGVIVLRKPE